MDYQECRPTTGRYSRQSATGTTTGIQRVFILQANTRPTKAQAETNHILIGNRQLWSQICGQTERRITNTDYQGALSGVNGLVRPSLLWNKNQAE